MFLKHLGMRQLNDAIEGTWQYRCVPCVYRPFFGCGNMRHGMCANSISCTYLGDPHVVGISFS